MNEMQTFDKVRKILIPFIWGCVASFALYILIVRFGHQNVKLEEPLFIGLCVYDVILLVFCPFASALGLTVSFEMKKIHEGTANERSPNLIVGLALGLVVSLYFIGSIQNSISALSRLLAFCILLGYQAPNIWFSQEHAVKKIIDKRLKEIELEKN